MRSSITGNRITRLVFFQHGLRLVIVEGFIKKSRATPDDVLKLAKRRRSDFLRIEAEKKPMSDNPHLGTSLEDFLAEDDNLEAATTVAVKRIIAWQLGEEMSKRKLSKTAMAKLMHTSRAQLDRVLNPEDGNVTLETLQRAAKAVGKTLRLELVA